MEEMNKLNAMCQNKGQHSKAVAKCKGSCRVSGCNVAGSHTDTVTLLAWLRFFMVSFHSFGRHHGAHDGVLTTWQLASTPSVKVVFLFFPSH